MSPVARSVARDPRLVVLPVIGLMLGLVAGLFLSDASARGPAIAQATPRPSPPPIEPPTETPTVKPKPPRPVARPVRVVIPSIKVNARIDPVGLNADSSMEVPEFGRAGWYTKGPRPGQPGPSVVVAHVDSYKGPDVFFRLAELKRGDRVIIRGADGSSARWRVVSSEQTPKDELPTERIWNDTTRPVLRLVTCGGNFDEVTRHYLDNVIVYADPVRGEGGSGTR
jgi:sortase (surface protein transpeptidase)